MPEAAHETKYCITEGVSGYNHYHYSVDNNTHRGLCGAHTMHSYLLLHHWGGEGPEHFAKRYTWCKECEELKKALEPHEDVLR
jgi:hypothetical protein